MSNTEQISTDPQVEVINLRKRLKELESDWVKVVDTNKVQSNMLKEREQQLKANNDIIESLEAKVYQQHEEIKEYKQNLLVIKQQIERVLG